MFFKDYSVLFLTFLAGGTSIALSANSWVTCWLGLEINLISIIPLIIKTPNFSSTESTIKYFIPQSIASLLLIAGRAADLMGSQPGLLYSSNLIISVGLLIKLGAAPFHFWFPQVILSLEWMTCGVLIIWQKIAPFILLISFSHNNLIIFSILSSRVLGALGGINQYNLKLIIAYSSIAHARWLIGSLLISSHAWILYFTSYSMISLPIVLAFNKYNISKTGEIFALKINPANKILFIFNVISLGGLPPFVGFLAKLLAITVIIKIVPIGVIVVIIISSLLALFYYTKMFFNHSLVKLTSLKINIKLNSPQLDTLMILSFLVNLLTPGVVTLL